MLGVRERVAGGPSRPIKSPRPPTWRWTTSRARGWQAPRRAWSSPLTGCCRGSPSRSGNPEERTLPPAIPPQASQSAEPLTGCCRGSPSRSGNAEERTLPPAIPSQASQSAEPLTGCCRGSPSRSGNPEERTLPPAIPSQASQSADAGRRARLRLHSPLVLKAAWRLRSPRRPLNAGGRGWTGPARPPRGPRRRRTRPVAGRSRTPAPRPRARWRGDRDAGVCAPPAGCPRP